MDERLTKERTIWDRMSAGYDRRIARYIGTAYRRTIEAAVLAISAEDIVADIGCGTGIVTLGIAGAARHVTAYDISEKMIAIARTKAEAQATQNVEFHEGDGYHLPHESGAFDVVLLCNVLHVIASPSEQLAEAFRLLKPGGTLITATDCYAEPTPLLVRLGLWAQTLAHWFGAIPYLMNYRRETLQAAIEAAGFRVVRVDQVYAAPVSMYVEARKG